MRPRAGPGWRLGGDAGPRDAVDGAPAARFLQDLTKTEFSDRRKIASQFVQLAEELGADLPGEIRKVAGLAHCNREILEAAFQQRALSLYEPASRREMLEKAASLHEVPEFDQEQLEKLAGYLHGFDQENGLTSSYGRGIIDPHRSVWNETEEEHRLRVGTVPIGEREWKRASLDERLAAPGIADELRESGIDLSDLAGLSAEKARLANQILA